jgi:hypothetical protein
MLRFCHEWTTSASGRKDKEHQKTAMHTVAVLIYDALNPFELGVALASHRLCIDFTLHSMYT